MLKVVNMLAWVSISLVSILKSFAAFHLFYIPPPKKNTRAHAEWAPEATIAKVNRMRQSVLASILNLLKILRWCSE